MTEIEPKNNDEYTQTIAHQSNDRHAAIEAIESLIDTADPTDAELQSKLKRDLALNYARLPEQNPDDLKHAIVLGYEATRLANYVIDENGFYIDQGGTIRSQEGMIVGGEGTLIDPSGKILHAGDRLAMGVSGTPNLHRQTIERYRAAAAANYITAMAHTRYSLSDAPDANNTTGRNYLRNGQTMLADTKTARRIIGDEGPDQFDCNWYARIRMMDTLLDRENHRKVDSLKDSTFGVFHALRLADASENPAIVYGANRQLTKDERLAAQARGTKAALALHAFALADLVGADKPAKRIARKAL